MEVELDSKKQEYPFNVLFSEKFKKGPSFQMNLFQIKRETKFEPAPPRSVIAS